MYADGLLLISVTFQDLHKMLDIVCAKLSWLDMVLNVTKSCLMRIGPRFNADVSPVWVIGTILPLVEQIYLGIDINTGISLRLCMHSRQICLRLLMHYMLNKRCSIGHLLFCT